MASEATEKDVRPEETPGANGDATKPQDASNEKVGDKPAADDGKAGKDDSNNNNNKKNDDAKQKPEEKKGPAGGFDATPLPKAPPGYTIKITFHKATSLPMADVNSLSSDPYIVAQLYTDVPQRHKEDPPLRKRTPTIRRSTDPEWNTEWVVANVPASGFKLKCRIYDEDPATQDDRLGNAHVVVNRLDESWPGINNQPFKVKKRMGSKRAYFVRMFATCMRFAQHMSGDLWVSVEMLGKTKDEGGRMYTVGPTWFTRHYSALLGRMVGTKDEDDGETPDNAKEKKRAEKYNFQANQMQLTGPVPWQLYHRYVEFKPFVKGMFTKKGVRGMILGKALHHQHMRVYAYDRTTVSEVVPPESTELTKKFLDLVHYDKGGRIFTYVLTLDALWRFTETGKEFGIDMLSKHTMHSDVNIYIAFSGEFFIRRLQHRPSSAPHEEGGDEAGGDEAGDQPTHPPDDVSGGPPDEEGPKDPSYYELVIDNDSGTYRPNAKLLPLLKEFLHANLPGLSVLTLDCQEDSERMGRMKQEQRERKKREGDGIIYTQWSDGGSISSSDYEALDDMQDEEATEEGLLHTVRRDAGARGRARKDKIKGIAKGRDKREGGKKEEKGAGSAAAAEGSAGAEAKSGGGRDDAPASGGQGAVDAREHAQASEHVNAASGTTDAAPGT